MPDVVIAQLTADVHATVGHVSPCTPDCTTCYPAQPDIEKGHDNG